MSAPSTTTETTEAAAAPAPPKALEIRPLQPTDFGPTVDLVSEAYLHRRSLANIYIFRHPYFFASIIPLLAFIFGRYSIVTDLGNVMLLSIGLVMAVMSLFARITDPLKEMAKSIVKGDFLSLSDTALVANYGEQVIGVVSLKYVNLADYNSAVQDGGSGKILEGPAGVAPSAESDVSSKRSSTTTSKKSKKDKDARHAIITSWTVVRRYRHVGLGSDLIGQALEVAKKDGIESLLIQCLSLEKEAAKSLRRNGFELVSSAKLPGGLGRLGIRTDTYAIDVKGWAKAAAKSK
ncbi:hypothetical protein BZA70DRAFT_275706 [Myxozyma melibiosi]|uniref:N-acetyltransferase domain-containing protein n=1 Tax=Myxozyma melibiosi TaxID=54550 RepID=A0ABR1F8F4_9ASCO